MNRRHLVSLSLSALVFALAGESWPVSNTGAIVLKTPVSSRARALGETGVADNTDPANVWFNPANVVGPARVYAQGTSWYVAPDTYEDMYVRGGNGGLSYETGAEGQPLSLAMDVSFAKFSYGQSIATDPTGVPLGTFEPWEKSFSVALGAGYLFQNGLDLRLGAAVKQFWAEYLPAEFTMEGSDLEMDAVAFDVGATLALRRPASGWSLTPALAVACVNMGSDMEGPFGGEVPLPTRLHAGTSLCAEGPATRILGGDVPMVAVVCNLDVTERFHDEPFSVGFGTELSLARIAFLRMGVFSLSSEEDTDEDGFNWGFGFGIPAGSFRARFDYTQPSGVNDQNVYGLALTWML